MTDRQTDGWAIAYSALSICAMLSCTKNETEHPDLFESTVVVCDAVLLQ